MRLRWILRRSVTGCVGIWLLLLTIIYLYLGNGPFLGRRSKSSGRALHLAKQIDGPEETRPLDRLEEINLIPAIAAPKMVEESPRVAEYCNHPSSGVRGQEGEVPEGYKLVSVHVVTRHGARTSIYSFPNKKPTLIPCTMDARALSQHPKLRAFVPTMKVYTGRQHPASWFKNWVIFPDRNVCRAAELTGIGALQHILLGDFLNKRYIHKWQLFGGKFSPDKIRIIATEFSRTYQSAISLLYGFLPRFNLTELLIHHSSNVIFCDSRYAKLSCECPAVMELRNSANKQASSRKYNPNYRELASDIADVYSTMKSKLFWNSAMMDIFMGQACLDIDLMCNPAGRCITADTLERLWDHLDEGGRADVNDPNRTLEVSSRLAFHPFLTEIAARMANISNGDLHTPRFVLYSGHDTTVSPLAMALGIHDGKWPPYATRLIFEQYSRTKDGSVRHYVRVLFNGKDVTRDVRFCDSVQKHGLCELKKLQNFVQQGNLNDLKANSYEEACRPRS